MRSIIRLFKGAGILNLLGMTVAFAAIYIIMVQVITTGTTTVKSRTWTVYSSWHIKIGTKKANIA